jgi:hypothetical protein
MLVRVFTERFGFVSNQNHNLRSEACILHVLGYDDVAAHLSQTTRGEEQT